MNFNEHSNLRGNHAFLSPSKYHWINYDDDKLIESYSNWQAVQRGTELHDFARRCIELDIPLRRTSQTLNMYVNDAIGYRMQPEQVLVYSDNCYGTADAICFNKNLLRIHDLKTGKTPGHIEQLLVYMALFCLEYKIKPTEIKNELRIYQNDEIVVHHADPDEVLHIIDKIITFDKLIGEMKG